MNRSAFRGPVGYHAPPAPSAPTAAQDPGPAYLSEQVKVSIAVQTEQPIYTVKRRYAGVDVAVTVEDWNHGLNLSAPITFYAYAIHRGIRSCVASGRWVGHRYANSAGAQILYPPISRVLAIREAVFDTLDITMVVDEQIANALGKTVNVSVDASDESYPFDNGDRGVGVASTGNPQGFPPLPLSAETAFPIGVPLFTPPQNMGPGPVLDTATVTATPAVLAAGLYLQIFDASAGVPAPGTPPNVVAQVIGSGAVDLGVLTRGMRWPRGVYVATSTAADTFAAPAAGTTFAVVWYR